MTESYLYLADIKLASTIDTALWVQWEILPEKEGAPPGKTLDTTRNKIVSSSSKWMLTFRKQQNCFFSVKKKKKIIQVYIVARHFKIIILGNHKSLIQKCILPWCLSERKRTSWSWIHWSEWVWAIFYPWPHSKDSVLPLLFTESACHFLLIITVYVSWGWGEDTHLEVSKQP